LGDVSNVEDEGIDQGSLWDLGDFSDVEDEALGAEGTEGAATETMSAAPGSSLHTGTMPARSRSRSPVTPPVRGPPRVDIAALPTLKLPPPRYLRGTEWWATPLWCSIESRAMRMPAATPKRPLLVESFCAGMCTEAFGFKVLRSIYVAPTTSPHG